MSQDSFDNSNLLADLTKPNVDLSQKYKQQNDQYKERAAKLGTDKKSDQESYDNMDYGDEFNDEEEARYRKETYGTSKKTAFKNETFDEPDQEDSESEISNIPKVTPLAKEFSKRANRGTRMTALVGKAQDEDDDFWAGVGNEFFGGGSDGAPQSDDEDFHSVEHQSAGGDSFDSDFGKSSEEQENEDPAARAKRLKAEESEDEDRRIQLEERREATKKKVKFHQSLNKEYTSKRQQKQDNKEKTKLDVPRERVERNLRKSSRIPVASPKPGEEEKQQSLNSSRIETTKVQNQESENTNVASVSISTNNKQKAQTRAPVGSLTNNPEWNGIISELELASKADSMSYEQYLQWQTLLRKDNLTPMEKMQEAAFTELINTRSLEQQKFEEDERMKEFFRKHELFKPDEKVFKYKQSTKNKNFLSEYVFPSIGHYPKSFNTKDTRDQQTDQGPQFIKPGSHLKQAFLNQKKEFSICPITGMPAKYRDPLTGTPYANKEAFKIIREKYFQRDEEKLFVRLQVLNDLLTVKRDKLKKIHQLRNPGGGQNLNESAAVVSQSKSQKLLNIPDHKRQQIIRDCSFLHQLNYQANRKRQKKDNDGISAGAHDTSILQNTSMIKIEEADLPLEAEVGIDVIPGQISEQIQPRTDLEISEEKAVETQIEEIQVLADQPEGEAPDQTIQVDKVDVHMEADAVPAQVEIKLDVENCNNDGIEIDGPAPQEEKAEEIAEAPAEAHPEVAPQEAENQ